MQEGKASYCTFHMNHKLLWSSKVNFSNVLPWKFEAWSTVWIVIFMNCRAYHWWEGIVLTYCLRCSDQGDTQLVSGRMFKTEALMNVTTLTFFTDAHFGAMWDIICAIWYHAQVLHMSMHSCVYGFAFVTVKLAHLTNAHFLISALQGRFYAHSSSCR